MKSKMPAREWLFRQISTGIRKPMLIWIFICVIAMALCALLSTAIDDLTWVEAVGVFLDPGVFGGSNHGTSVASFVMLIIALLSLFFVCSMMVSMITNMFENITVAYKEGDMRYNIRDFVLVIGVGNGLPVLVEEAKQQDKVVVVYAPSRPLTLNNEDYIFYRGTKEDISQLKSIHIEKAEVIYILSDAEVENDDSKSIACFGLLRTLSAGLDHALHCFVEVCRFESDEVFAYSKSKSESGNLMLVDFINSYEYDAEQLMVHTDFLPIIHSEDTCRANIVLLGANNVARGAANIAAHICHYPHLNGAVRKTRITIMDPAASALFDRMYASRPELFRLSSYTLVSATGERTTHLSEKDFLDVEWEFADLAPDTKQGHEYLTRMEASGEFVTRYVVCAEDESVRSSCMLHLPKESYRSRMAVYVTHDECLLERARDTEMYGDVLFFGPASGCLHDAMLTHRSDLGRRVNYVYNKAYSATPAADEETAWYAIPEAHKLSSIYCAMAFPLRYECFDWADRTALYEAEHRRWMESVLLMGYYYGPKKEGFAQPCIVPFDALPKDEQEKDALLMDAADYILGLGIPF